MLASGTRTTTSSLPLLFSSLFSYSPQSRTRRSLALLGTARQSRSALAIAEGEGRSVQARSRTCTKSRTRALAKTELWITYSGRAKVGLHIYLSTSTPTHPFLGAHAMSGPRQITLG